MIILSENYKTKPNISVETFSFKTIIKYFMVWYACEMVPFNADDVTLG